MTTRPSLHHHEPGDGLLGVLLLAMVFLTAMLLGYLLAIVTRGG